MNQATKPTLTVACISLKSVWQAVSLRSALTALLLAPLAALHAADKPNIIVILADDMGYADAGFNGCKDIPTPHLDSIAKNGIRFSAGYVCAPQNDESNNHPA